MTGQPTRTPTRDGVLRAADKIAAILPPTPLLPISIQGHKVWAKAEVLQPIGSFKIRGAWHRLTDLTEEERAAGVVGLSSGNHAQGVAWAARALGIAATIVMPADAPAVKLSATRALGADIVLYDRYSQSRDEVGAQVLAERGGTLVHAYADAWVIEGQGTLAVEAEQQLAAMGEGRPTRFVTCCGGGGLTAGVALAVPGAEVVPVEPEGWDDIARSLATGHIESVAAGTPPTACDALMTPATAPINFAVLRDRCSAGLSVTAAEVRTAQRFAFQHLRLVVEPGGAVALAAALAGKVALHGITVLTLTGGNTGSDDYARVLASDD